MKITIEVDFYTLKQAKYVYRLHHGLKNTEKVTREDLAIWFGSLVSSDMDACHGDESEIDEDE